MRDKRVRRVKIPLLPSEMSMTPETMITGRRIGLEKSLDAAGTAIGKLAELFVNPLPE